MHISEAVLAGTTAGQQLLLAGAAASAVGVAIGLYKLDYERLPRVAVLSSAFFVASLIHYDVGGSSEHLVLAGLLGLVLGWAAFPAVFVALLLQAVFFYFGGLTALGLNTLIMALPAVVCHYLFRSAVCSRHEGLVYAAGFAAGAVAILLGAALSAGALLIADKSFDVYAKWVAILHLPLAVIEGFVTGSIVVLLRKVRPEVLDATPLVSACEEAVHA